MFKFYFATDFRPDSLICKTHRYYKFCNDLFTLEILLITPLDFLQQTDIIPRGFVFLLCVGEGYN